MNMKDVNIFLEEIKGMNNDSALVHIFKILDVCEDKDFFNNLFKCLLSENFNEDLDVGFLSATIFMKGNINRGKYYYTVINKLKSKYSNEVIYDIMRGL